jgi:hypothetical protein
MAALDVRKLDYTVHCQRCGKDILAGEAVGWDGTLEADTHPDGVCLPGDVIALVLRRLTQAVETARAMPLNNTDLNYNAHAYALTYLLSSVERASAAIRDAESYR